MLIAVRTEDYILKRRDYLGDLGVNERIILKCITENWVVKILIRLR
jgi:hypothetical protein